MNDILSNNAIRTHRTVSYVTLLVMNLDNPRICKLERIATKEASVTSKVTLLIDIGSKIGIAKSGMPKIFF